MTKEEKIEEVCLNSINLVYESLAKAVSNAVEGGYKIGWEECYKAFKLDKLEQL